MSSLSEYLSWGIPDRSITSEKLASNIEIDESFTPPVDNTTEGNAGNFRYNPVADDFEGYGGNGWVSLGVWNLTNVDNTSDLNKPISTATQTALDTKFNKTGGDITGPVRIISSAPSFRMYESDTANNNALLTLANGDFLIQNRNDADTLQYTAFSCDLNGSTILMFAGSPKVTTTNTGVNVTGNLSVTGDVGIGNTKKVNFGSTNDLSVYHNGTNSYMQSAKGDFLLDNTIAGGDTYLRATKTGGTVQDVITVVSSPTVTYADLKYDGGTRLTTTNEGISVVGRVSTTTAPVNNNDLATKAYVDGIAVSTTASNADKLDNLDSTQFLRSDVADAMYGNLSMYADIIYPNTARNSSATGTYDANKTQQIWSMGVSYKNSAAGTNFGNLYGLAYYHTNNGSHGTLANGHQVIWAQNGSPTVALGNNIWTSGQVYEYGATLSSVYGKLASSQTWTGTNTFNGPVNISTSMHFDDADILYFGTGDDVRFFNDGAHMYTDLGSGIGNWYIRDDTITRFTFDDAGHFTATGNITSNGGFVGSLTGTASNATSLNGVAASNYGRKDIANTWSSTQTFSATISAPAGITGTASNATSLNGVAASNYGRKDTTNTWSSTQTFSANIAAPAGITGTLTGTATNANSLGGIAASAYPKVNTANTWTSTNTFSGVINANGGVNGTASNASSLGGIAASLYPRTNVANTFSGASNFPGSAYIPASSFLQLGSNPDVRMWSNGSHIYSDLGINATGLSIRDGVTTRVTFHKNGNINATGIITAPTFTGSLTGTASNASALGSFSASDYGRLSNTSTQTWVGPNHFYNLSASDIQATNYVSDTGIIEADNDHPTGIGIKGTSKGVGVLGDASLSTSDRSVGVHGKATLKGVVGEGTQFGVYTRGTGSSYGNFSASIDMIMPKSVVDANGGLPVGTAIDIDYMNNINGGVGGVGDKYPIGKVCTVTLSTATVGVLKGYKELPEDQNDGPESMRYMSSASYASFRNNYKWVWVTVSGIAKARVCGGGGNLAIGSTIVSGGGTVNGALRNYNTGDARHNLGISLEAQSFTSSTDTRTIYVLLR